MNTFARRFVVAITYNIGNGVKSSEKYSFDDMLSAQKYVISSLKEYYIEWCFKVRGKNRSHKKDLFKDSWRIELLQKILLAEEEPHIYVDKLLKVFHAGNSNHRNIQIIEE